MGGGKKAQTGKFVVDYHLSFHLGFCVGPVDTLRGLWFKERPLPEENQPVMGDLGRWDVHAPTLFGDIDREGGVDGRMWYLPGHANQVLPDDLAGRFEAGMTGETAPGFRNLASLGFVGNGKNGQPGFYVGSNYPQVPAVWGRFTRAARTLSTEYSIIELDGRYHANPAHMIHECLVNQDFGMGGSPTVIDQASFMEAAEVLYNEGFGLSTTWTRSATIERFIQEILDTINAMFFFNPTTGKAQIKLIRDDYDRSNLPHLNEENVKVDSFRRKLFGETVNEIIVKWMHPEKKEMQSIVYQDLGNIAMQGEVISEERNYDMVRNATLASVLGARDITLAASPIATAVVTANRRSWKHLPGDVVYFSSPKHEVEQITMRIMDIDYGTQSDSKIRITLVEDIFSFGFANILEPPSSEWQEPGSIPAPYPIKVFALPKPMSDGVIEHSDSNYPMSTPAILMSPPPYDIRRFILNKLGSDSVGNFGWQQYGVMPTAGRAAIAEPLIQEVESVIKITGLFGGLPPEVLAIGYIGDVEDPESELVAFSRYEGDDEWTVIRAVYDTTPKEWPAGTPIWIMTRSFFAIDWDGHAADQPFVYRTQPVTSKGTLPLDDAHPTTHQIVARPYMPFRPAHVRVGGVMFGVKDWYEEVQNGAVRAFPFTTKIQWSNRNRNTEDSIIRRWDDGEVAPEEGQTTEIVLLDLAGNEIHRITGLLGTEYDLNDEVFAPREEIDVMLVSRYNGIESLQGHKIRLRLQPRGFGYNWGLGYGGWIGYGGE